MLCIIDKTFKFYNFKAIYPSKGGTREEYVDNKEEFEEQLKERIQRDAEFKARDDWFKTNPMIPYEEPKIEVELPEITYKEIIPTKEELERLSKVNAKQCGQLDDVKYYVINGTYPKHDHSLKALEIDDLKVENKDLKRSQAQLLEMGIQEKMKVAESLAQIVEYNLK